MPDPGARRTMFSVHWCGTGEVKGSPFATRAAAEQWIKDMCESARAAKQQMYGHYEIREVKR